MVKLVNWAVAIDEGLSKLEECLQNWLKEYKENGYNIVERKRGGRPTMPKERKKPKSKRNR